MLATRSALPRKLLVVALVATAFLAACGPTPDSEIGVGLVNWQRSDAGVPHVYRSGDLDAKAQAHAVWMARNRTLAHSNLTAGVDGPYSVLAENVGVGSSMAEIHVAFMGSSSHRANILNRRSRYIGVGEARGSDGRIYVAMVFKG